MYNHQWSCQQRRQCRSRASGKKRRWNEFNSSCWF